MKDMPLIYDAKKKLFLKDKICLVNGLSSDIGAGIAQALAMNGCIVIGTYCKNTSNIDALKKSYGDKIHSIKIDFDDDSFIAKIKKAVEYTFSLKSRIDILVNVSGIWVIKPYLYVSDDESKRIWRVNFESASAFCKEAIKKMIVAGGGEIINVASTGGIRGAGQQVDYAATKAALINLTKSLAEEFGPRNIKVNSISPGPVDTKALNNYLDEVSKELIIKNIPRTRLCHINDVANAALGILINDYMTGNDILLHGGKL